MSLSVRKTAAVFIFLILAATFNSANASVNVSGNITTDTTWGLESPAEDGTYIVTGNVTVTNGAELTIEAGVQVRFSQNLAMYIGGTSSEIGVLTCEGTSDQPITFTSNQTTHTKGYWQTLYFKVNSDESTLLYTNIEYGGGSNGAMVYLENSDASMMNCFAGYSSSAGVRMTGDSSPIFTNVEAYDNNSYGMYLQNSASPIIADCSCTENGNHGLYNTSGGFPDISDSDFSSNTTYGIYCSGTGCRVTITDCTMNDNNTTPLRIGANRIGFTSGNTFADNENSYIECMGATVIYDAVWEDQGIPYRMTGDVTIEGRNGPDDLTTVTIEPGVTMQFDEGYGMTIGRDDDQNYPGCLIADGSAGDAITFTRSEAGLWWGIYFSDYASDDFCLMANCLVEYGGSSGDAIRCNYCSPIITDTEVSYADNRGIYPNYSNAEISNCNVSFCGGQGIYVNHGDPEITNCQVMNNSDDGIYVTSLSSGLISGCTINGNGDYGIYLNSSTSGPTISNNTIIDNLSAYSIRVYARHCPKITGNTLNKDINVASETITDDATWYGQDTAYRMSSDLRVQGLSGDDDVTVLTLQAGVVIKFNTGRKCEIGDDDDPLLRGGLMTYGTETNPVIFTTDEEEPEPGLWGEVLFSEYAEDSMCELNYTIIEYAGEYYRESGTWTHHYAINCRETDLEMHNCIVRHAYEYGIYARDCSPVITDCTITDTGWQNIYLHNCDGRIQNCDLLNAALGYDAVRLNGDCETDILDNLLQTRESSFGIRCNDAATAPTITGNTFQGDSVYPIRMHARNVWKIGQPLNSYEYTHEDRTILNRIYVVGDTITLDSYWYDQNTPYYISGDVTISGTDGEDNLTTLEIEAGALLHMNSTRCFHIGSNSHTAPGALIAQGTSAERIVFTCDSPSHGYWDGIHFYNYASDADCLMEYCDVFYGGYDSEENIYCEQASPTFRNCRFFYGLGNNVYSSSGSNPTLEDCEIAHTSGDGVYVADNSDIHLNGCYIHDNTSQGVYLNTAHALIDGNTIIQDNLGHGVYVYDTSYLEMTNTTISDNNSYGLYCNGSSDTAIVSNCLFDHNNHYPIRMYASKVDGVTNCTYTNNRYPYFLVIAETIFADSYWENSIPYRIASGDLIIEGKDGADSVTTLTLEAGAELYFDSNRQLIIGDDSDPLYPGALNAVGSLTQPIIFSANHDYPEPGHWDGLYFSRYSDDDLCLMEYCEVWYGGYDVNENVHCNDSSPTFRHCRLLYGSGPNLWCNSGANPVLEDCEIAHGTSQGIYVNSYSDVQVTDCYIYDNSSYGIYVYNSSNAVVTDTTIAENDWGIYCNSVSDTATINGCIFEDNWSYPIRMYARHIRNITGCQCPSGRNPWIYVVADTINYDSYWENPIEYYISGDVYVQGTDGGDGVTTLTLQEGSTLRFASQVRLQIGHDSNSNYPGALTALGTPSQRIVFTAKTDYPYPGYWDGLYFCRYSNDTKCRLHYCDVKYGGYSSYENVHCNYCSPTFKHCRMFYGDGPSFYAYNYAEPILEDCELAYSSNYGLYVNSNAKAHLTDCNIHDNSSYGIYIVNNSHLDMTESTVQDNNDYGLYFNSTNDSGDIQDCLFYRNASYPIHIYASEVSGLKNCTFVDNNHQKIYVYGDTIGQDSVWEDHGIPYRISSSAHINVQGISGVDNVTSWTIEKGTVLEIDNVYLYIGHNSNSNLPGALIADGTPAEPIVFTSNHNVPNPGDWYGIYFARYTDDNITLMDNCIVEYGGNGGYENISCHDCSPLIQNCEIRYCTGYGVQTEASSGNLRLVNCHIHDNVGGGVNASPGNVQITGGIIENNNNYGIYINENIVGPPSAEIDSAVIRYNTTGYGMYIDGSNSTPRITNCMIHDNNSGLSGYGIYVTNYAMPVIGGPAEYNSFDGHYSYAVYNSTTSTCIDAQYNFWGAAGGPYDTGFGNDGCMDDGNDNPTAEKVSEDVDYGNWVDNGITPTPALTVTPTYIPTAEPTPLPPSPTPLPCLNDGDVNNDGEITISDAQYTYMIVLGAYTPTAEEECSADCNGLNGVTIGDAQCMYMNYLGLDCDCADEIPGGKNDAGAAQELARKIEEASIKLQNVGASQQKIAEALTETDLIWIDDADVCKREEFTVNVRISNPSTALDAFGFTLQYDSEMLTYAGYEAGEFDQGWIMFGCNEPWAGEIRAAGFVLPEEGIPANSNGVLVQLRFKVKLDEVMIGDGCDIRFAELTDDLAEWRGMSGSFSYCELKPADTPEHHLEGRTLWLPVNERPEQEME